MQTKRFLNLRLLGRRIEMSRTLSAFTALLAFTLLAALVSWIWSDGDPSSPSDMNSTGGSTLQPKPDVSDVAQGSTTSASTSDLAQAIPVHRVVANIPVGNGPLDVAVSPDGARIYVANAGSDGVSVIDGATDKVIKTIAVKGHPSAVKVNPSGTKAFVVSIPAYVVTVIDVGTGVAIREIELDGESDRPFPSEGRRPGIDITPDGRLFVSLPGENYVAVIDGETYQNLATIAMESPHDVGASPNLPLVYVLNRSGTTNSVTAIDTSNNRVSYQFQDPARPEAVAFSPTEPEMYVVSGGLDGSARLSAFDPYNPGVRTKGRMPFRHLGSMLDRPFSIAVTYDGKLIYVSNWNDGVLSVAESGDKFSFLPDSIQVGVQPAGLAVSPITGRVYVANYGSNSVSVIEAD